MGNIWNTPEAEAWRRDYTYQQYVEYCKSCEVNALWSAAYSQICSAFNKQEAFNKLFGEKDNGQTKCSCCNESND